MKKFLRLFLMQFNLIGIDYKYENRKYKERNKYLKNINYIQINDNFEGSSLNQIH